MSKSLEISIDNFDVLDAITQRIELLTIFSEMSFDYFLREKITAEQLNAFNDMFNGDIKACVSDLNTLLNCIQRNVDMQF